MLIGFQGDHFDLSGSLIQHVQTGGSGVGQINDPLTYEWSPIVNLHHDAAAIFQVGHPRIGGNRQALVGGGQLKHVEWRTAGGLASVKIPAVPGGNAGFPVTFTGLLDAIAPAKHNIGIRIAATAGRFCLWNRIRTGQISAIGNVCQWAR